MHEAEQELTDEEVIERLQETETLIDKLKEIDILESKLREVRDLEERLQEMDEVAERIQEVIEEELGKEEVTRLREEELAEAITEAVLEKSVKIVEAEDDDVDELEDEIKRVFLKGLLPEEDTEVKGEGEKEVTDESRLDESSQEQMHQRKEFQNEIEEESGSSDIDRTVSVGIYEVVAPRTKKRVTIVEGIWLKQEEMEGVQGGAGVMSEEGLATEATWHQTEQVEANEREVPVRLQPEDVSQDIWFILFDRPPYKAVFTPGTVCCCSNRHHLNYCKIARTSVSNTFIPLHILNLDN